MVEVAFAEPFMVRSRDPLVDKDEREHAPRPVEGSPGGQGA